jgi:hypothetical protein
MLRVFGFLFSLSLAFFSVGYAQTKTKPASKSTAVPASKSTTIPAIKSTKLPATKSTRIKSGTRISKVPIVPDSLTGREQISKTIFQLRDSIDGQLKFISEKIDTTKARHAKIERAKKKLKNERERLTTALENIAGATRETWEYFIHETSQSTLLEVRETYEEVKKDLVSATSDRRL